MSDTADAVEAGGSFTIPEWCRRRRISVAFYYKMQKEGWGPRTMSAGGRQLISAEADDKWRREREAAAAAGIRRALPPSDSSDQLPPEARASRGTRHQRSSRPE